MTTSTKTNKGHSIPKKNSFEMDLLAIRKQSGLTQAEFWAAIDVSQAGGSRYEKEGQISYALKLLIELIHFQKIDPKLFDANDYRVGKALREVDPKRYESLLKSLPGWSFRNPIKMRLPDDETAKQ